MTLFRSTSQNTTSPLISAYVALASSTSRSLADSAVAGCWPCFAGYQPLQLSVTWPWRCGFSRSSGGNAGSMGIPRLYETRDITQTMPRLRRSLSFTPKTNSNPRPVHCRVVKSHFPQLRRGQSADHSLKRCLGTAEQ